MLERTLETITYTWRKAGGHCEAVIKYLRVETIEFGLSAEEHAIDRKSKDVSP